MKGIFDYLRRYKDVSFKEKAFNEVDALILSQFSYAKWEQYIPGLFEKKKSVSVKELKERICNEVVFSDPWFGRKNQLLFYLMCGGKRFGTMCCNYRAKILNEGVETQFCAFVCILQDTYPVVVFRGTDENLIGWKEDFNLVMKKPVLAQLFSGIYLNRVAEVLTGKFIICGHSKGGNLAIFSAIHAADKNVGRIKRIYSFDGPGFRKELLKSYEYVRIKPKIRKYLPKSSVVGMLLNQNEECRVIKSKGWGFLQHNPYAWRIKDDHFIRVSSVKFRKKLCFWSFDKWITKLPEEEILFFTDTLFDLLWLNNDRTTFEWIEHHKMNLPAMKKQVMQLDKGDRIRFFHFFMRLILL